MNAWADRSADLVSWTETWLVIRRDVWGVYVRDGGTLTAPPRAERGRVTLSSFDLARHFSGGGSIGLHSTSADDRCKWLAFDIDRHSEGVDADANWRTAQAVADTLLGLQLEPVVEDSNGAGGYHVWTLLSEPVSAELCYRLARYVKQRANAADVEGFPKQPTVRGGCGNWLRVPGKHHRRDHWSRVWDTDAERWRSGADAVEALLASPVNDADTVIELAPILPALPQPEPTRLRVLTKMTSGTPACIRDLLATGIRRTGDRNRAILTLCRYYKHAGILLEQAVAECVAFTERIPAALTTSSLTRREIEGNCRSVATSVYGGEYPFDCWHAKSLGTPTDSIACDAPFCEYLDSEVPDLTEIESERPELQVVIAG